jgi:hypothetical protein
MNVSFTDIAVLSKKKVKNITLNIDSPKELGSAVVTAVNIFRWPKMADVRIEILLNFFCDQTTIEKLRAVAEKTLNGLLMGFDAEVLHNTIKVPPPTTKSSIDFYGTLIIRIKR